MPGWNYPQRSWSEYDSTSHDRRHSPPRGSRRDSAYEPLSRDTHGHARDHSWWNNRRPVNAQHHSSQYIGRDGLDSSPRSPRNQVDTMGLKRGHSSSSERTPTKLIRTSGTDAPKDVNLNGSSANQSDQGLAKAGDEAMKEVVSSPSEETCSSTKNIGKADEIGNTSLRLQTKESMPEFESPTNGNALKLQAKPDDQKSETRGEDEVTLCHVLDNLFGLFLGAAQTQQAKTEATRILEACQTKLEGEKNYTKTTSGLSKRFDEAKKDLTEKTNTLQQNRKAVQAEIKEVVQLLSRDKKELREFRKKYEEGELQRRALQAGNVVLGGKLAVLEHRANSLQTRTSKLEETTKASDHRMEPLQQDVKKLELDVKAMRTAQQAAKDVKADVDDLNLRLKEAVHRLTVNEVSIEQKLAEIREVTNVAVERLQATDMVGQHELNVQVEVWKQNLAATDKRFRDFVGARINNAQIDHEEKIKGRFDNLENGISQVRMETEQLNRTTNFERQHHVSFVQDVKKQNQDLSKDMEILGQDLAHIQIDHRSSSTETTSRLDNIEASILTLAELKVHVQLPISKKKTSPATSHQDPRVRIGRNVESQTTANGFLSSQEQSDDVICRDNPLYFRQPLVDRAPFSGNVRPQQGAEVEGQLATPAPNHYERQGQMMQIKHLINQPTTLTTGGQVMAQAHSFGSPHRKASMPQLSTPQHRYSYGNHPNKSFAPGTSSGMTAESIGITTSTSPRSPSEMKKIIQQDPHQVILQCWERITKIEQYLTNNAPAEPKIHEEIERLKQQIPRLDTLQTEIQRHASQTSELATRLTIFESRSRELVTRLTAFANHIGPSTDFRPLHHDDNQPVRVLEQLQALRLEIHDKLPALDEAQKDITELKAQVTNISVQGRQWCDRLVEDIKALGEMQVQREAKEAMRTNS